MVFTKQIGMLQWRTNNKSTALEWSETNYCGVELALSQWLWGPNLYQLLCFIAKTDRIHAIWRDDIWISLNNWKLKIRHTFSSSLSIHWSHSWVLILTFSSFSLLRTFSSQPLLLKKSMSDSVSSVPPSCFNKITQYSKPYTKHAPIFTSEV